MRRIIFVGGLPCNFSVHYFFAA